ncbi:type II secretion system F family protein [Methanolobus bombayensis]|uniref:type II secretion system F family protein n=1 Tax=Methanolobus bombayensis TaxID=38023 RepID=UPI001AEA9429|nr:type II secretion system F family protein [Methanolobus bombayensis]MBP1909150.1 flagellar protein FlaJ [Methanolobus bombayensis]
MNIEKYRLQIERYIQILTLRYDVKREYLTLGIPVFIAFMILLTAVLTGHSFVTDEAAAGVAVSDEDAARKAAYEALVAEMEAAEAAERGEVIPAEKEEVEPEPDEEQPKDDLDHIMVFAILVAIIPYSLDSFLEKKKLQKREVAFSEFLYKLSELMRGGIDPVKGFINLSKTNLGAISSHAQDAASSMVLGRSFDESMHKMSESMKSRLVARYIDVVVQAAYTGGNVADLLFRTSEDMRSVIAIQREKEANLKQYIVIFYLAQGIIIMLTYILSTSLLPLIQGVGMEMLGGAGLSDIDFERGFFHMIILNALFGGLIVGLITEGEMKHGFKHSAILIALSYVACVTLLLPAGAGGSYMINVISGDGQEVMGGIPLQDPIVFNVTDMDGNPAANTFVKLSINPSGTITSSMTEDDGTMAVTPIPGSEDGTYIVTATAGESKGTATIIVKGFDD